MVVVFFVRFIEFSFNRQKSGEASAIVKHQLEAQSLWTCSGLSLLSLELSDGSTVRITLPEIATSALGTIEEQA